MASIIVDVSLPTLECPNLQISPEIGGSIALWQFVLWIFVLYFLVYYISSNPHDRRICSVRRLTLTMVVLIAACTIIYLTSTGNADEVCAALDKYEMAASAPRDSAQGQLVGAVTPIDNGKRYAAILGFKQGDTPIYSTVVNYTDTRAEAESWMATIKRTHQLTRPSSPTIIPTYTNPVGILAKSIGSAATTYLVFLTVYYWWNRLDFPQSS